MGGVIALSRPLNCAMSAVGVGIGGVVAVGAAAWGPLSLPLALAAAAAAAFTAGGNALNDVYDVETDRVNHPERPLPSGRLTTRGARTFAAAAFLAAAGIAAFVNPWCAALVGINAVVMIGYEERFKSRGASGNVVIAYLVGSLFLFAGLATFGGDGTALLRSAVLAALASATTLGREITKDIEDIAGDVDRRTLPQRIGARRAGLVASLAFGAGVAMSAVPWAVQILGLAYALLVLPADGMFIYAALHSSAQPARAQRVAKYAMIVALAAFLAGGVR